MDELTAKISENEYSQTVERKIPPYIYVIIALLYVCVAIFTFLGTMWGFPMLVFSLGSLFLAWYLHGTAKVTYEYSIHGTVLTITRRSGMKIRPVVKHFAEIDLANTILAAWQGTPEAEKGEEKYSKAEKHRVSYNTSAQDVDNPSIVVYCKGKGSEAGWIVRLYLQPTHQLIELLSKICPGKVFIHE